MIDKIVTVIKGRIDWDYSGLYIDSEKIETLFSKYQGKKIIITIEEEAYSESV